MSKRLPPLMIQARVDAYATPDLYEDLELIPPGVARINRLKSLAQEALTLRRQSPQARRFDKRLHDGAQDVDLEEEFTKPSTYQAKSSKRTKTSVTSYRSNSGKESESPDNFYQGSSSKGTNVGNAEHDDDAQGGHSIDSGLGIDQADLGNLPDQYEQEAAEKHAAATVESEQDEVVRPARRLSDSFLMGR